MKNLFFYLSCLTLLVSCEKEFVNTYIIKNTSSHNIEIKGYDKIGAFKIVNDSTTIYTENIFIEPNSDIKKVKQAGYHSENQGVFDSAEIDSITIIFDSVKIISFACKEPIGISCSGKYNLMNYEENYQKDVTGHSSGKEEYTYTYTISEDDYINAEPIE